MKSIFLSILVLFSLSGFASHISVSGTLGTDTYWIGVDTVRLTGDLTINEGVTLLIGPGTVVEAQGMFGFIVQGTMKAFGSVDDSIKFTCVDKTTGWNRIVYNQTPATNDSSIFQYCIFEYGNPLNNTQTEKDGGAFLILKYSYIKIHHCLFNNNSGLNSVISLDYSNIIVSENTFRNNSGYCILTYVDGSGVTLLTNNKFFNNKNTAIYLGPLNKSFVHNNLIMGNYRGIRCYICSSIISNNTIVNNTNEGIDFWGDNASTLSLYNNIIRNNEVNINIRDTNNHTKIYNCNIEGGFSGITSDGNWANSKDPFIDCIDEEPEFIDEQYGNYGLISSSPCVDKGIKDTTGLRLPKNDLAGNKRISNGRVDIGAYEYNDQNPLIPVIKINSTVTSIKKVTLSISFNKEVTTFELGKLLITNGTASNLIEVKAGLRYTFNLTATDTGTVIIELPKGAVYDLSNNQNLKVSVSYLYTTSINDLETTISDGQFFFPNPVSNQLTIQTEQPATITIMDMAGKTMFFRADVMNQIIDMANFPSGLYLIKFETESGITVRKVMKE